MEKRRMIAVKRSAEEQNQLLARILKENGVADWEYSLDGYTDDRMCMERDERGWIVYFAERGMECRCEHFDSQKAAARELAARLGREEEQRARMLEQLNSRWREYKLVPAVIKETHDALSFEPVAAKPWYAFSREEADGTIKVYNQDGKLIGELEFGKLSDVHSPYQTAALTARIKELEQNLAIARGLPDAAAVKKTSHMLMKAALAKKKTDQKQEKSLPKGHTMTLKG